VLRLALHPDGMAHRVETWPSGAATSPAACATGYSRALIRAWRRSLPNWTPTFPARIHTQGISASPVPLRLRVPEGELRLITTFTSFATAVDVTLSELRLEAFLPADETTATILRQRR